MKCLDATNRVSFLGNNMKVCPWQYVMQKKKETFEEYMYTTNYLYNKTLFQSMYLTYTFKCAQEKSGRKYINLVIVVNL